VTIRPLLVVDRLEVTAYTVPTDLPEADGTLSWDATTIVVVQAHAADFVGLGYTYADLATATLIETTLAQLVVGADAQAPRAVWAAMVRATRNLGRPGLTSMAISAVDIALWDLHARTLQAPLVKVLGAARDHVAVYGSGGFTSYSDARLAEQLHGWVAEGIPRVKMKVGAGAMRESERIAVAREAIGEDVELFVDANGAYSGKQALALAQIFSEQARVSWFEEPVSSDDLAGLRLLRDNGPAGMDIAAGEYGYDAVYFERMLAANAVDVLQVDVTRCGGVTEFVRVAGMCRARNVPLSCHCGPAAHAHVASALAEVIHLEYFHDHVRIEELLFDGLPTLKAGALWPDLNRPGLGLELKSSDAERFAA
jgi:L-alanine-DL-glutamate epimerase-like enolase superfamily enzyme